MQIFSFANRECGDSNNDDWDQLNRCDYEKKEKKNEIYNAKRVYFAILTVYREPSTGRENMNERDRVHAHRHTNARVVPLFFAFI